MTKMRQWTIFTVVAVLVVLAAGWLLLVKPEKSKVADLNSQTSTQDQANQLLLTQIASLQAEQKALPQQQLTLAKFTTEVPDNPAEPALIRQLSTAANGAGVDLISMTPGTSSQVAAPTPVPGATTAPATGTATSGAATSGAPAAAAAPLVELPVALGVTGSYANMVSFFQSLENLPRAMLVSGWSICPLDQSSSASTPTGGTCQLPTVPSNKTPPTGTLGGILNATVFYSPVVVPTTPVGATTTAPATGSTAPTTGSTAQTPASTAPAN